MEKDAAGEHTNHGGGSVWHRQSSVGRLQLQGGNRLMEVYLGRSSSDGVGRLVALPYCSRRRKAA